MGQLDRIWIKRAKGGPMDPATSATLVAGRGLAGNADQGGKRQVTLIDAGRWQELMHQAGSDADPSRRRANLMVSGLDLFAARGRRLRIGTAVLRVAGETRPCEQMDAVQPGLQAMMRNRWGGGAFAEVEVGGVIAVGDVAEWIEA